MGNQKSYGGMSIMASLTMEMECILKFKVSLWDAIKMRIAGRQVKDLFDTIIREKESKKNG